MDFNYGEMIDKMTNCCDEISDPTTILVASRIAQDHDPMQAGPFVESDRIEKSWAGEKLVIQSLFHSDRIISGIGPWGPFYYHDLSLSQHGHVMTNQLKCGINLFIDSSISTGAMMSSRTL